MSVSSLQGLAIQGSILEKYRAAVASVWESAEGSWEVPLALEYERE